MFSGIYLVLYPGLGNAAGKLALGADGLEQFNFFVTDQVRVPGQDEYNTGSRRDGVRETLRVAMSASLNCVFWKSATALPKARRSWT